MRTWKIIVVGTALSVGLITAIAHDGSNGFEHGGTIADQATNSRRHVQPISTVANSVSLVEKADTGAEPCVPLGRLVETRLPSVLLSGTSVWPPVRRMQRESTRVTAMRRYGAFNAPPYACSPSRP